MPWDLIGNERVVKVLSTALAGNSMPHSFLFFGPQGTGRATAARRLAQALNCTGDSPPCLECTQCKRIENGIHSDVHTETIEENATGAARTGIVTEQIVEMEKTVALAPYEGRTRVVIIDPASSLTDEAQNKFLKTLEEPPPHVVFVLISDNVEAMLETVRSRCTPVEFKFAVPAEIEAGLLERGVEPEKAHLLSRLAGGRVGWAVAASSDPKVLERRADNIAAARNLPTAALPERMDAAEKLSEAFKRDRDPVMRTLEGWEAWWRDVLLIQSDAEDAVANVDMLAEARQDAAEYSSADIARFLKSLLETRESLAANVQSRIALEALMLDVPGSPSAARAR